MASLHPYIDNLPHNDHVIFFYGSVFSQWAACDFTIDGVKYNCAEQYMMAMKATVFGDDEALGLIMSSYDPAYQKAVGRRVKNFDADVWNRVSRNYVIRANLEKFRQPAFKDALLSTGDRLIVEASPTDRIWGIGLSCDDSRIWDLSEWRGTNWLGQCLMEVRRLLRG